MTTGLEMDNAAALKQMARAMTSLAESTEKMVKALERQADFFDKVLDVTLKEDKYGHGYMEFGP